MINNSMAEVDDGVYNQESDQQPFFEAHQANFSMIWQMESEVKLLH